MEVRISLQGKYRKGVCECGTFAFQYAKPERALQIAEQHEATHEQEN